MSITPQIVACGGREFKISTGCHIETRQLADCSTSTAVVAALKKTFGVDGKDKKRNTEFSTACDSEFQRYMALMKLKKYAPASLEIANTMRTLAGIAAAVQLHGEEGDLSSASSKQRWFEIYCSVLAGHRVGSETNRGLIDDLKAEESIRSEFENGLSALEKIGFLKLLG